MKQQPKHNVVYVRMSAYILQYMLASSSINGVVVFSKLSQFYNCLCRNLVVDHSIDVLHEINNGKTYPKMAYSQASIERANLLLSDTTMSLDGDRLSQSELETLLPSMMP